MQPAPTRPRPAARVPGSTRHLSVHIRPWRRAPAAAMTVVLSVALLVLALPVEPARAVAAGGVAATTVSTTVSFVGAGGVVLHGTVVAPRCRSRNVDPAWS